MPDDRQHIVILGGGFGGVYTAMYLERLLKGRRGVEVALVSRDNYLVFQPLIPEVVSAAIGVFDTIAPLRRLCPRTRLYTREVTAVDLTARTVTLSPGVRPRPTVVSFDHLVIALGNTTGLQALPGGAEHALPFKSLGDALHLRNHLLHVLEEASIESEPELRRELTTFVIAGGGFSGVELAAQINDFVRYAVRHYPGINPKELAVVLLHSHDRVLPELDASLGRRAERVLSARGVEIRFRSRLSAATPSAAVLANGDRIPTRTIISTVPSVPNPLVLSLRVERDHDRIAVDERLAVPGHDGVWAVGDCAAVHDPRSGALVPPTAQHAIREARCAAYNIVAALDRRTPRPFHFSTLGHLASLGQRSAVGSVLGVRMSGLLAWWLWRTVYLFKLPGLDRKIRVAFSWTLDILFHQDIVQLKTDRSNTVGYEHFEAGEIVIQQGDLGDKLYCVKAGEVEVIQSEEGRAPARIATFGPGDYFGEMALLADVPRTATVKALTPTDLMVLSRAGFQALVGSSPELKRVFEDLARRRLHASDIAPPRSC